MPPDCHATRLPCHPAELSNRIGDEFLADEDYRDATYAYQRAYELYKSNEMYRANTISAFTLYGDRRICGGLPSDR